MAISPPAGQRLWERSRSMSTAKGFRLICLSGDLADSAPTLLDFPISSNDDHSLTTTESSASINVPVDSSAGEADRGDLPKLRSPVLSGVFWTS